MHHYRHHKKSTKSIDNVMDVVAVVAPLLGIPQAVLIFSERDASGVSLFSWVAFAVVAIVFLMYAIAHKIKPLIVTNALWLVVYVSIIPGILIYG